MPGPGLTVPVSKSRCTSGWCRSVRFALAMMNLLGRSVGRQEDTIATRVPNRRAGGETPAGRLLLQLLHPDVAVADELLREVAAAVDLQRDPAGVRQPLLRVLVLHEPHPLDPG